MTFLLDVNVLIALLDPLHVEHDSAHDWFARVGQTSWATCALTENGVLRVVGHANYPNSPGSPALVAPLLERLRALPGHVFWPGDLSLLDAQWCDSACLLSSSQVTDSYLLALAGKHDGQLATFDRRLVTNAVRNGAQYLHLID